jgi:hypothetical protein
MAHLDRDRTTEFLARVNGLLAEAKATGASMAQTDHILARELVARRDEMLKEVRGTADVLSKSASISVHLVPTPTRH